MSLFSVGDKFGVQSANAIRKLWASSTAPSSPEDGEIWLDISASPYWLKRYNTTTSSWERIMVLTASEILTLLKTVDGSGSGLDADLLDGKDSTAFVLVSDYEDADVLAKIKNVDGSGSGLDADLLDGKEGSFYRNASNLNAGTVSRARLGALWQDTNSNLNTNPYVQTGSKSVANNGTITYYYAYTNTPRVVISPHGFGKYNANPDTITTTSFIVRTKDFETGNFPILTIDWIAIGQKT